MLFWESEAIPLPCFKKIQRKEKRIRIPKRNKMEDVAYLDFTSMFKVRWLKISVNSSPTVMSSLSVMELNCKGFQFFNCMDPGRQNGE